MKIQILFAAMLATLALAAPVAYLAQLSASKPRTYLSQRVEIWTVTCTQAWWNPLGDYHERRGPEFSFLSGGEIAARKEAEALNAAHDRTLFACEYDHNMLEP